MGLVTIGGVNITETKRDGVTEYAWDAVKVYKIPVRCYWEHVTNMYLVLDGQVTLIDAALNTKQAALDLDVGLMTINRGFGQSVDIPDISSVVITHGHADHWGMLADPKFKGKKVYVHELDSEILKDYHFRRARTKGRIAELVQGSGWSLDMDNLFSMDTLLSEAQDCELKEVQDGQRIINDYQVYHVPGHSPGHICLKIGPVLFLGDHILSQTTPLQIPGSMIDGCGLRRYLSSLRKVSSLEELLGLPAHEDTIYSLKNRIDDLEAFHYRRLLDILGVCQIEKNLFQITDQYYQLRPDTLNGKTVAELSRDEQLLALQEIKAHLEYLIEDSHVVITGTTDEVVMYRAKS